ncbi:MAG: GntR family transcriptional regulator [Pseudomonadota bacterium]
MDHLHRKIRSGELAAHAPLPSERAIAEEYGISRMTARRALIAMETEGLAYSLRRRGRFVSPHRLTYNVGTTISFLAESNEKSLGLEVEVISTEVIPADADIAEKLAIPPGEDIYRYLRLFRLKGHPSFIEYEYSAVRHFPGFFDHDMTQSTTLLMEREYNMPAESGDIVVKMRALTDTESELLGLLKYHVGMQLEQTIHTPKGVPIFYSRQLWRGELAEFTAHAAVRAQGEASG